MGQFLYPGCSFYAADDASPIPGQLRVTSCAGVDFFDVPASDLLSEEEVTAIASALSKVFDAKSATPQQ